MHSFAQLYGLYEETTQISLEEINTFKDDKLFVTVGGGIGVGKTSLSEKIIGLPIIDINDYIIKVGGGTYDKSNVTEGRKLFNFALKKALQGKQSFIHMGNSININGTKKILEKAKDKGFTNVIVMIDKDPEIVAQQIQESGKEISTEKITKSHNNAFGIFNKLKRNSDLIDFYVHKK